MNIWITLKIQMEIVFLPKADKAYKKLPTHIRKKVRKSLAFLLQNQRHPSLNFKKIKGTKDIYEVRVDKFYRYTLKRGSAKYILMIIGPHDVGLGIK